ncbi:hypothetical protein B0H19DRAFT_1270330 [Mycena capillaripes]|nr:hypothetical protein B0H19DRAFT_1270330 [Mycena capillaripes]
MVAAESRPCNQLEPQEVCACRRALTLRASRSCPSPPPPRAHPTPRMAPLTGTPSPFMCSVFVGGQLSPYAGCVGRQLRLYTVFVAIQSPRNVAFVDTGTHTHTVFVGLRARPYVAFVGTACGLGQHAIASLSFGQPALVLPLSVQTPAGGPTPSTLHQLTLRDRGVVTFKTSI